MIAAFNRQKFAADIERIVKADPKLSWKRLSLEIGSNTSAIWRLRKQTLYSINSIASVCFVLKLDIRDYITIRIDGNG